MEISKELKEIYKNINISDQVDNMKKLDRKELLLLLIQSLDDKDVDVEVYGFKKSMIYKNISHFKNDLQIILNYSRSFNLFCEKDFKPDVCTDPDLLELTTIFGEKIIVDDIFND